MINRKPLREDVQREILARIADRRLPPGGRINESYLSAEIGVSRTPLREAMLGLEAAGFLSSDPGRGFQVPPLDAQEFLAIQQVLSRLAPLALERSALPDASRLMELQNLVGRARVRAIVPGPEREEVLGGLAHRWSALVVGTCSNAVLVGDIARLETLAVRYWRAAALGELDAGELLASYEQMYGLLRQGGRDEAARLWSEHISHFASRATRALPLAAAEA